MERRITSWIEMIAGTEMARQLGFPTTIAAIAIIAVLAYLLFHRVICPILKFIASRTSTKWDDDLLTADVLRAVSLRRKTGVALCIYSYQQREIPLELYFFTSKTDWAEYERIQSEIFDYVYAIISRFGLRINQAPSGLDIQGLSHQKLSLNL